MAWKWVSDGERKYCINLDRVDYLTRLNDGRTIISFGVDGNKLTVNQPAGFIVSGEDVSLVSEGAQPGDTV